MNAFLWNVILALIWMTLTGVFTPGNLAVGFGMGALILWFAQRSVGTPNYLIRVRRGLGLIIFFIWQLVLANLRVAYDVVTPRHHMRPGILAIPLDAQTDAEIVLLTTLITLTPGTLSLDVSSDRRTLYIHSMYIEDEDSERQRIKDGFERRVLEVLR